MACENCCMCVEVPHPPACLPSYRHVLLPASYKDLNLNTLYYLIHPKLRIRIHRKKKNTAPDRSSHPPQLLSLRPSPHDTSTTMIIRLGRLTPGYFRLLQRQVAGEVQTQPHDRSVNQIAMMLAIMGLSFSYYSAKQMTAKVQAEPAP